MTTFGLTDLGFVPMAFADIRSDLQAALQAAFGASIDLGDKSIFGQIVGILAERYALLWELGQALYSALDPDAATGASLDAVCALTGTYRPAATYSTVTATLTGTPTTVVASGSQAKTASTGSVFSSTSSVTIAAVSAWTTATPYVIGNRVTNGGNVYQCAVAGTSSGGPSGTGTGIADGATLTWDYLGVGTGAVDVTMQATVTGDITAVARDLTAIVTTVTGWDSVNNVTDATPGRALATDEELRTVREAELAVDGQSTADAIRAAILNVTNVLSCTVFQNLTDSAVTVDGETMPAHSVEALVRTTWAAGDPLDQGIYNVLWQQVAAGIVTTGTSSGTVTDSQGVSQTVKFSHPTEIPIYVIVNATVDATKWPADGVAQVQNAIVTWGQAQDTGKDAVAAAIIAQAFSVAGMLDATVFIGTAPSPASSTTIAIDTRHLATYSSANITVNVTDGTP